GVFDRDQVDEIHLGLRAAQADLERAQADVVAAEAQAQVAQADLAYARTMLGYTTIRAPFDGVITERHINTDDFVQPAGTGKKDLPLYVVEQIDPVRVFINVPATDAPWIRDGDPVRLRLQGAGGRIIEGKGIAVKRNARALNPQARTLRTEIDVPNPPNPKGRLLPGMYVQATITVEHANAWTIPDAAFFTVGDQMYCYRVVKGKAVRTALQVGLQGNGLVEVLAMQQPPARSGEEGRWQPVTGSEEVVASNPASLTDGQAVAGAARK
ncbi:MAG TPA: efflux RND transporter periplasmic adaptor subunit, partial [Gemmataceae bacterium]|nr:efflux RND transporter periplasmic adaptor subunit [Gemmataceae bacterium]